MTDDQEGFNVNGKHIFLVGGGGGIGLALMRLLVPKGASFTFATKDPQAAKPLVAELEALRVHPSQHIICVMGLMRIRKNTEAAIKSAIEEGGSVPDIAILSAGFAEPGLFLDHSPEALEEGISMQYWSNCWPAHVLASEMRKVGKPGHIVFINNVHAESSWSGYSAYAPGKYALKGLADVLREELARDRIRVSLLLAPGGFEKNWDTEMANKADFIKALDEQHGYRKLDAQDHARRIVEGMYTVGIAEFALAAQGSLPSSHQAMVAPLCC